MYIFFCIHVINLRVLLDYEYFMSFKTRMSRVGVVGVQYAIIGFFTFVWALHYKSLCVRARVYSYNCIHPGGFIDIFSALFYFSF